VKIDWKKEIGQLTRAECNDYLLRLMTGKANIELELQSRFAPPPSAAITVAGTIQDVLDGQDLMEQEAQERQAAIKAQAEQNELDDLAENYEKAWQSVALAIEQYKSSGYNEAVVILQKLKKLAHREGKLGVFQKKVDRLCAKYPTRRSLMERLRKAQIVPQK
jgi:hypothetical protein